MYAIFKNSLIVSCQAEEGEPLHGAHHMQRMALAAVQSGAKGIRANSAVDVQAIKKVVDVPVIGLIKDRDPAYDAFITTTTEQIHALVEAGADLVAIDSTRVSRPVELEKLYQYIKDHHPQVGIVADVADIKDAEAIIPLKPDFISTTLSGYTDYSENRKKPDLELIDEIKGITDIPVIAEGNYNEPYQIRQAILRGAYTVIVGGAITRPQQIAKRFVQSLSDLKSKISSIGIDIGATRLRGLLIDQYGNIINTKTTQTPQEADGIIKTVSDMINDLSLQSSNITSLGIATAGRCDEKRGTILYATDNIKNWTGREIGKEIFERTGMFPIINNDANLAAYGQWKISKEDSLVLMTVGTGIGAGIVIDGKLINGAYGGGAEVGHIILPGNQRICTCSKRGCVETVASAKALKENLESHPGEETSIMNTFASTLAWLIDTVQRTVEAKAFYLSGSIIQYGEGVLSQLNQQLKQLDPSYKDHFVQFSDLDEMAGAKGAAFYALDHAYKILEKNHVTMEELG
ncbi:MAG TPA: putative N-acetylmannosamine-6-phosphate 2-epimerase [Thermotogota bacterium]|nr:putative N-acetylmannosamine-6-phosphate 2-epimerase [Thermotogota bacterium]